MAARMTPRERVLAAVDLKEADRVPIDIGGTSVTTIVDGKAHQQLKTSLGIQSAPRYFKFKSRSTLLDEGVFRRLHSDTRPIPHSLPDTDNWEDIYYEDGSFKDEFGVIWRKTAGDGMYAPVGSPLREATMSDLAAYRWPDPLDPGRTRCLREQARHLHEHTDYAVCFTLPSGMIHLATYLRGFEEFMVDLAINHAFLEALLDACTEWYLELTRTTMEQIGPHLDVVLFGDDIGFQTGPMVDLARYRRLFKPRHRRIMDCIRRQSAARILYHTDGAVTAFIDDLLEIGVDALNPVQASAAGMNTRDLKARFGDRICFWGGIDTQSVLPMGTPEEVHAEVRRRIQDLAPGGGYVLASVHNLQVDVPIENVLAMADAALECGAYPICES